MVKVGDFIQLIQQLNPRISPVRLALYNYLSFFQEPQAELLPNHIEQFLFHCMEYPNWVQSKSNLCEEVRTCLESLEQNQSLKWSMNDIRWVDQLPLVPIDSDQEALDCIQNFIEPMLAPQEKLRLLTDKSKIILAFILNPENSQKDSGLKVLGFHRKFIIRKGFVQPLRAIHQLSYSKNLELTLHVHQQMEMAPGITALFQMNNDQEVNGFILRGPHVQKASEIKDTNLSRLPKLFLSLKKIEKNFINKNTDPFYLQMTSQLERVNQLIRIGDAQALEQVQDVMAMAQNALEFVFEDDKLLSLLIRDLEHTLKEKGFKNVIKHEGQLY